jgi:hypothetical protein
LLVLAGFLALPLVKLNLNLDKARGSGWLAGLPPLAVRLTG